MTRIIMTRHGQSVANEQRLFAGHSDFDLTELGRTQARLTAEYICEHEKIDVIYSSDLLRAYNTAVPTAEHFGLEIIPYKPLREIYAGEWEGMNVLDIDRIYAKDFDIWKNDFSNARCTGGESISELYARATAAVIELAQKHDGKTVLLSTHAALLRTVSAYACGLPPERVHEIEFSHNASINIFTYENGVITPERLDIHEHIGALSTGVIKELNS